MNTYFPDILKITDTKQILMNLLNYQYLSRAHLKGLDNYKVKRFMI